MSQEQLHGRVEFEGKYGIQTHYTSILRKMLFLQSGIKQYAVAEMVGF